MEQMFTAGHVPRISRQNLIWFMHISAVKYKMRNRMTERKLDDHKTENKSNK